MQIALMSTQHGYDDYDIDMLKLVHRVCIGRNIRIGDVFNVYCSYGVKLGATWAGSIEASLRKFETSHRGYKALVAENMGRV
jgi:hypothetical protein